MEIRVKNLKKYKGKGVYIGRQCYGKAGSPLANPYRIGVDGTREEVIEQYRKDLEKLINGLANGDLDLLLNEKNAAIIDELNRLALIARKNGELTLICWCKPAACHGDVIGKIIKKMCNRQRIAEELERS